MPFGWSESTLFSQGPFSKSSRKESQRLRFLHQRQILETASSYNVADGPSEPNGHPFKQLASRSYHLLSPASFCVDTTDRLSYPRSGRTRCPTGALLALPCSPSPQDPSLDPSTPTWTTRRTRIPLATRSAVDPDDKKASPGINLHVSEESSAAAW